MSTGLRSVSSRHRDGGKVEGYFHQWITDADYIEGGQTTPTWALIEDRKTGAFINIIQKKLSFGARQKLIENGGMRLRRRFIMKALQVIQILNQPPKKNDEKINVTITYQ